jgi:CBS domain-containing protein
MIASILAAKGAAVVTTSQEVSLRVAAQLLTERRIGAVAVTDSAGQLAGILSERDIVRAVARDGAAAMDAPVSSAMTAKVVTASPADRIDAALARMTDRRIRHLPVIQDGALVGFVSIGDLVKAQIDMALAEADAMRAYIATG